ncbi:hypothetical protein FOMG_17514 [Fusarium oxysporum f. sp. melonis 26406]|uniref:Mitochondrial division protein 1 n=1 Tax=Fusarium oxysporum f. sp. melonis 26406 TaxID=1089452 RepID=W9Z391_FUSOX|nr:hypothetical protein FOMG_17514 [Fusarium oxysporum f. sp. melonis 26406]
MMEHIINSDDADLCKQILAIASVVYSPVTLKELISLVESLEEFDQDELKEIIGSCGSFLTLRKDVIHFVHQSAKEYLLDKASNKIVPSGTAHQHHTIFSRSLLVMSRSLRRDMYDLHHPDISIDDILAHGRAIGNAPLQAYVSALTFSPRRSVTRRLFKGEEPSWILAKPTIAEDWDACLETLEGHDGGVNWVAFSPDGQRLASASIDGIAKVWDATTVQCLATFVIGSVVDTIRFDKTGTQLLTDNLTFNLNLISHPSSFATAPASSLQPYPCQCQGYGISADRKWITYRGGNLL